MALLVYRIVHLHGGVSRHSSGVHLHEQWGTKNKKAAQKMDGLFAKIAAKIVSG